MAGCIFADVSSFAILTAWLEDTCYGGNRVDALPDAIGPLPRREQLGCISEMSARAMKLGGREVSKGSFQGLQFCIRPDGYDGRPVEDAIGGASILQRPVDLFCEQVGRA
jgi:hypothetical protein